MNTEKTLLVKKVVGITGMKNMLTETVDAIERTTREAHVSNWFKRDLTYAQITFDQCDPQVDGERVFSFPSARIRRLYELVAAGGSQRKRLLVASSLGDYFSAAGDSCCLINGVMMLKSSMSVDKLMYGAFTYPDVSDNNYRSWIAQDYQQVIVHGAAYQVLADVSDNHANAQLMLHRQALARLHIDAETLTPT